MHWPGLEIVTRSKRYYPEGKEFAHILGYVAEANEQELAADPYLALGDTVGKQGLEYVFEQRLRGHKGLYNVEVDVLGRSLGKTLVEEPQNGENLQLCLDTKLQKQLAALLGDQTGSIVVMEPQTGRLLALVTNPSYDNNVFVGGLSQKDWVALRDDPFHPLQNRAIQSVYPPGSVWKLMMAGLSQGGHLPLVPGRVYRRCEARQPGIPVLAEGGARCRGYDPVAPAFVRRVLLCARREARHRPH